MPGVVTASARVCVDRALLYVLAGSRIFLPLFELVDGLNETEWRPRSAGPFSSARSRSPASARKNADKFEIAPAERIPRRDFCSTLLPGRGIFTRRHDDAPLTRRDRLGIKGLGHLGRTHSRSHSRRFFFFREIMR